MYRFTIPLPEFGSYSYNGKATPNFGKGVIIHQNVIGVGQSPVLFVSVYRWKTSHVEIIIWSSSAVLCGLWLKRETKIWRASCLWIHVDNCASMLLSSLNAHCYVVRSRYIRYVFIRPMVLVDWLAESESHFLGYTFATIWSTNTVHNSDLITIYSLWWNK